MAGSWNNSFFPPSSSKSRDLRLPQRDVLGVGDSGGCGEVKREKMGHEPQFFASKMDVVGWALVSQLSQYFAFLYSLESCLEYSANLSLVLIV